MRTAAILFVLLFAPIAWAESIAVQADGTGSCTYPIQVAPGDMIDATISVDYELPVSSISEGYPPSISMMSGVKTNNRMIPTPVNWESYSAEVVDGKVRIQLEMPPLGETVTIRQQVVHDRSYANNSADSANATVHNDPRPITIQLTVTAAAETGIAVDSTKVSVSQSSQEVIVLPEQLTDDMGLIMLREPLPVGAQVVVPIRVGRPQYLVTDVVHDGEGCGLYNVPGPDFTPAGKVYEEAQFDWDSYSAILQDDGTVLFTWVVPPNWTFSTLTQTTTSTLERLTFKKSDPLPHRSQLAWGAGVMISIQYVIAQ